MIHSYSTDCLWVRFLTPFSRGRIEETEFGPLCNFSKPFTLFCDYKVTVRGGGGGVSRSILTGLSDGPETLRIFEGSTKVIRRNKLLVTTSGHEEFELHVYLRPLEQFYV